MDFLTGMILTAVLIGIMLIGIGIIYLKSSIQEKRQQKEEAERQEAEKREEEQRIAYLEAPADKSEILTQFHRIIQSRIDDSVNRAYEKQGKSIYTQKGELRVDYTNALQKKRDELMRLGICEEGLLLYIEKNGGTVSRINLSRTINDYIGSQRRKKYESQRRYQEDVLTDGITPAAFLSTAQNAAGDMVGVYIIYNQTKNMYYVGQAKRLYFRVKQHFTGHGNGDVYADYKYGDSFLIRLMTLRESGYDDLDLLEKDMIAKYHAYESGYNKTAGNS